MLAQLADLLVPPACLVCRTPPPRGDLLCRACRSTMPWIDDPCPRCALPRDDRGCPRCPAADAAFEAAYAPVAHAGPARDLVLALKLRGALPAAEVMAAQIAARTPRAVFAGAALVPVPARAERRRRRGFDQAAVLAAALGRRVGAPVVACLHLDGAATRQLGRGRSARRGGDGGVAVRGPFPDAPLVVVDDVHTTGATLDRCARALRGDDRRSIVAVTYGRTFTDA